MAKLREVINGLDPSKEQEAVVKEALQMLVNLAEEKVKVFTEEIKTDLQDGKLNNNSLKVPITYVIGQYEEYRAVVKEGTDIVKNIGDAFQTMFYGDKNIVSGVTSILQTAVTAVLGAAKGEESQKKMYLVIAEYPSIVRYDFAMWNRTIASQGIMSHVKNALAVVAVKSSVNISKLQFNDFLSLYGPILNKAFGSNPQQIKNMIQEAKDIYNILLPSNEKAPLMVEGSSAANQTEEETVSKLTDYVMNLQSNIYE